jgi:putative ABC transport system ATP-binding protein
MIELKNISVLFNQGTPLQHTVFENLNLQIAAGEFVTVIGGNGAGKSTLMNVVSGETTIQRGSIHLDNCSVARWPQFKRAKLISRVFQDPLLGSYSELTVEENLAIAHTRGHCRSLKSALNPKLRALFRAQLATIGIGLENRLNDKMGMLSGGQRQAISLIMATLKPSKILLLDEHTAALDPKMENLVLKLTQRLIEENKLTALMVTHCMGQALEYGTRTLVMHQGKIVHDLVGQARQNLQPNDLIPFF